MLQCRQGGEGDETAKGHWPAPEGELAGTAFSAAQPVGAVPVLSVPTGRNGSGQLYGPAAQPGRRVGELPGALSKYCVPSGCPQHRRKNRFLCICIPALLAVSLLCAVLLGAAKRRAVFFKSVLLLPYAIPVASIVVLWRALFSGKGLVNGLLVGLGCRPVDFMGSSAAFWVLIFTYLWRNNGYDMLLWLAGLETIPRPLYEADGATPFQTFVFITLPNLLPTVVLTTILSLVNSFKVFREAYLVAGNYPQESIYLLQHLFNNWFLSLDIGKLSAAAVLLALGLGCVVYLLYHFWGGGQE